MQILNAKQFFKTKMCYTCINPFHLDFEFFKLGGVILRTL